MRYHWKKRLTAMVACGVFAFSGTVALASDVELTLAESVEMALNNNKDIKISMSDNESAKWVLKEAKGAKSVSIDVTHVDSKREVQSSKEGYFSNKITASVPIYTGGRLESTINKAKIGTEVGELNLSNTKQQVKLSVTNAYFAILQAANMVQVSQETVDQLGAHLKNVNAQYAVGTVAKSDVLRSEVELADAEQSLIKAQNSYELAISDFNNLVGLPLETGIKLRDELKYNQYQLNLNECIEYAMAHRPDGIVAQKQIDMAKESVDIAKSGQRPNMSLGLARNWENDHFPGSGDTSNNWSLGLTTSLNLFDGNVTRAQIKQSEAAMQKSVDQAEQKKDGIQLEVRQAYLNIGEAEKRIQTSQVAVDKAQEDLKIAQVRYSAGVGTNIDVIDAQVALTTAQTNYIKSLYDYNTSKASLDKAMGIPIE